MTAIDTNLLIYAHRSETPEHASARNAIERALNNGGCGYSLPCVAEFWGIVTHTSVERSPKRHVTARKFLEELSLAGVEIWFPGIGFGERLAQLAEDLSVSGARIFDLQIGLIAFENGATQIWTHDRDFRAPPGLRVVDPLE